MKNAALSQSLDLELIEVLWGDLKQAVHARNSSNILQLKVRSGSNFAHINVYKKHL